MGIKSAKIASPTPPAISSPREKEKTLPSYRVLLVGTPTEFDGVGCDPFSIRQRYHLFMGCAALYFILQNDYLSGFTLLEEGQ